MDGRSVLKNMKSEKTRQLGIFWLVGEKLIIDSSLLVEAEQYGNRITHPRSHIDVWTKLELNGQVPPGSEYDEYPRGRVTQDISSGEFNILADRCILNRKNLVAVVRNALNLPKKAKLSTDPHYKCPRCLRGRL